MANVGLWHCAQGLFSLKGYRGRVLEGHSVPDAEIKSVYKTVTWSNFHPSFAASPLPSTPSVLGAATRSETLHLESGDQVGN